VSNAIDIVNLCIQHFGTPLYVRHEIVHNTHIVNDFKSKGVIFVEETEDVPEGAIVILSAHGVAPSVYEDAKQRQLIAIDATCPLVTKVHMEALKFSRQGMQTVLIGHRGHQELIGTSGYVDPTFLHIIETENDIDQLNLDPSQPIGYLTQTTLSISDTQKLIDKLKEKYPSLQNPPKGDICYATTNRQNAVLELAQKCDVVIICGSSNSSNSNRLRERAEEQGIPSYIIDHVDELDMTILKGARRVGISSGASVPFFIVEQLVKRIQTAFPHATVHRDESIESGISFPLPRILRDEKLLQDAKDHLSRVA
jgi:4-hydroxy-3-methylbut-2-enyl diphosphate reductase